MICNDKDSMPGLTLLSLNGIVDVILNAARSKWNGRVRMEYEKDGAMERDVTAGCRRSEYVLLSKLGIQLHFI